MSHAEHARSADRPPTPATAATPPASSPARASRPCRARPPISEDARNENAGAPAPPPPLPWLAWNEGERVVVRYRLDDGLHDALGTLLETAPDHVVVDTRRGPLRVEAETMVTGKKVPPPPSWPPHAER